METQWEFFLLFLFEKLKTYRKIHEKLLISAVISSITF